MKIQEALEILCAHLKTDESYRKTWSANIAMSFKNEWTRHDNIKIVTDSFIHKVANKAAEDFLTLLCHISAGRREVTLSEEVKKLNESIKIEPDCVGRVFLCPDCNAFVQLSWKEFIGYFLKFLKHNV